MKQLKVRRYLLFALYVLLSLVVPCVLVAEQYGFLTGNTNANKLAAGGVIIIFIVLFFTRKQISQSISNMNPCVLKNILVATKELLPFIIFYVAFFVVKLEIESVDFILTWSCLSNAVALVVRIYHLKAIDEINREYEKDKIKEALKETK